MTFTPARSVAVAAGLLAALLAVLGWLDYRAVSRELRAVVRSEAAALHATVAVAARAQHAAAEQAENTLRERLLDSARLLRELDNRGALTPAAVDKLVARNATYRVMLFGSDGRREYTAGELADRPDGSGGSGRGSGRGGGGRGPWAGPPPGAGGVAQRLLAGDADEITTPPHVARDGHERVAAGVRRASGGAIVLNAANRTAQELDQVYSLGSLLAQISDATPALAYIVLDDRGRRVAGGPLAGSAAAATATTEGEQTFTVDGAHVLERRSPIDLGDERTALLRIGMRLDDVARGERRTMVRVSLGSAAAFGLGLIALAFVSLQQRYGRLSVQHARAQEALARRDRLAAMGELASTVAHEVRNPLNAIAMSAQRLAREYPPPHDLQDREELGDLLGVIQRESQRINATVQQFLEFARPRPLNRRETDLAGLVEETAAAGRSVAGPRGITVKSQSDGTLPVSIDPDQLKPAIENLLRNAIEASPPGGAVLLDARRNGRSTTISISDQGPGIPEDVLPRIFDLYFTTKARGTGIGLPVAQQIVTAHGGTIEVESGPGRGTRMIVRLPDQEARPGG
jgi:signal transduction histidine kinase